MKKAISFLLTFALIGTMTLLPSAATTSYPLGDVDLNGSVNANDLTALARAVGGIEALTHTTMQVGAPAPIGLGLDISDTSGDGVIQVACVGDSITQGLGNTPYPSRLGTLLGKGYDVRNFGLWGTTACNNTDRPYTTTEGTPYPSSLSFNPEVVLIMLGTNDGGSDASNAQTNLKKDLTALIESYQALKTDPVVVLMTSPTTYNAFNPTVNTVIAPMQRELAKELNIPMLDMHELTADMGSQFQDGLHPSESGYFYVALMIYEQVFGKATVNTTVTTVPGAYIKMNAYETYADATGAVTFPMAPGNQQLVVRAENYESAFTTVVIPTAPSCTVSCTLAPAANLALDATAFDNGCAVYEGKAVASQINDGERTAGGWQPADFAEGDYVGLVWGSEQEIHTLTLTWETASYISSYADGGFEIQTKSSGEWKRLNAVSVQRTTTETDIVVDTVTVNTTLLTDGVRIVLKNDSVSDHKYAAKLIEMGVYGAVTGEPTVTVRALGGATGLLVPYPFGDIDLSGEMNADDLTTLARAVGGIEALAGDLHFLV